MDPLESFSCSASIELAILGRPDFLRYEYAFLWEVTPVALERAGYYVQRPKGVVVAASTVTHWGLVEAMDRFQLALSRKSTTREESWLTFSSM